MGTPCTPECDGGATSTGPDRRPSDSWCCSAGDSTTPPAPGNGVAPPPQAAAAAAPAASAPAAPPARTKKPAALGSRKNPFFATVVENYNLNDPRSSKETRHLSLSLAGSGVSYRVGDALGLFPRNDPELVYRVLWAGKKQYTAV